MRSLREREKQVPRCARNDRKKSKYKDKSKRKKKSKGEGKSKSKRRSPPGMTSKNNKDELKR
jgi:hypothetical protein